MASDGSSAAISAPSAVLNSQAPGTTKFQPASGKTLPQSGNSAAAALAAPLTSASDAPPSSKTVTSASPATATSNTAPSSNSKADSSPANSTAASSTDPQVLVNQINKYLNDSGQADQFRLDPDSSSYIQQVNPASGAVVARYAVSEFPALARSIGASSLLIDDTA